MIVMIRIIGYILGNPEASACNLKLSRDEFAELG